MFLQGTGRDIAAYISRLAWSFGSPNYTFSLSNVACFGPRMLLDSEEAAHIAAANPKMMTL